MNLKEKALVVNLSISAWSGRVYDKGVASEVEANNDAKGNAGNYSKHLVDAKHMKGINAVITEMRNFHIANTLPWQDYGPRLLPSENYMNYRGKIIELTDKFYKEVDTFVQNYDTVISDAEIRLGKMFCHSDYPTKAEVRGKFGVEYSRDNVADSDFRISNLSEAELEDLRESAEKQLQQKFDAASKDVWHRIKEQLSHMKERLSDEDGRVHASMFTGLSGLIELIPRLNIAGDPNLNTMCDEMKKLLVEPDSVRKDKTLKSNMAKEVDDVMSKMSQFF